MRRYVFTALVFLCFIVSVRASGAEPARQRISASIVTCPDAASSNIAPTAALIGDDFESTPVLLERTSDGYYSGAVSVPPGHYALEAKVGRCESGMRVTVLPNHDRNVGLVLRRHGRPVYEFESSLAGTLPLHIERVSLTMQNGAEIPLTVDGKAYYGEDLPDVHYTLVLYLADDLLCEIPVTVNRGNNRVNVSALDIRHTVGFLFKHPGKQPVFHLLWGNS